MHITQTGSISSIHVCVDPFLKIIDFDPLMLSDLRANASGDKKKKKKNRLNFFWSLLLRVLCLSGPFVWGSFYQYHVISRLCILR